MQGQILSSVAERRAKLVVQCACELLGIEAARASSELHLPLSVVEFETELRNRFGAAHPDLVFRTDSTLERARLDRRGLGGIPKVVLRQGAPRRDDRRFARAAAHVAQGEVARAEG
jgi:hypothetical protein